ncbi:MAG: NUDIX hydrolase [Gemmatimonadales bacterium]
MSQERLATRTVYEGRRINVTLDTVRTPRGDVIELEMVRHPGACAVVPLLENTDGDDPVVLLIRQYRWAAGGTIWEIPAGVLEPGEDPANCARRELEEEAGATAGSIEKLSSIWTTPGFTDEVIHLFVAKDLTPVPTRHQADELIETAARPLSSVMSMIRDGEIRDGKSIVALLYLARFVLGR